MELCVMQGLSSVDKVAASMCVVPAFMCVFAACVAAVLIKTLGTKSGTSLESPFAGFSAWAVLTVVTLLFFTLQALERAWYVVSVTAAQYRSFAAVMAWWLSLEGRHKTKEALADGRAVLMDYTDGSFYRRIDPKEPDPRPCKGNMRQRVGSVLWLLDVTDSVAHQRELCKNSILS
ncbi:hypothetical protein DOS86_01560 [Anaplasma marginale]|uniref:hypothetical protein n=1 Tax=Anaplasma marginale TaxID=770 RepID=UPI000DEF7CC7|nr:hypothetical protein [Anaplasma marginale]RCL20101.1 hypothetical protein DOS86_01560 [Anaplasma marginale]